MFSLWASTFGSPRMAAVMRLGVVGPAADGVEGCAPGADVGGAPGEAHPAMSMATTSMSSPSQRANLIFELPSLWNRAVIALAQLPIGRVTILMLPLGQVTGRPR